MGRGEGVGAEMLAIRVSNPSKNDRQRDGWTNRQADGRMDRWLDGSMDKLTVNETTTKIM